MLTTVTRSLHNVGMETSRRQRGQLRLYLGTGPGTGKTHAMLQEGHRLAATRDTVVAACDATGDRPGLGALAGLEVVGREPNGGVDVAAVLRRAPQVALVDGLSAPDRWTAVNGLLASGIDVVATVDVTEIEALSDTVEAITDLPVDTPRCPIRCSPRQPRCTWSMPPRHSVERPPAAAGRSRAG